MSQTIPQDPNTVKNRIALFDWQAVDVARQTEVRNVLNGNEAGTGKTYEAIALDIVRYNQTSEHTTAKTLVIAPLTALSVWEDHLHDLTTLDVVRINPKDRQGSWKKFLEKGDVFLIHWDAIRIMPELRDIVWMHVVADECHRAKNRKAQQTLALKKIPCQYKTAMSGTIIDKPYEFWSILNWLYPEKFSSYWKFFQRYTEFEISYPQGYRKVMGPKNADELLGIIDPFYTRHLKKDVFPNSLGKYGTDIWVDLTPQQAKAYNQMKKDMIAWIGEHENEPLAAPVVISQLVRLQQFALAYATVDPSDGSVILAEPSSKLDALMELLEDRPNDQIVVFSQFRQAIDLLEKRLLDHGISYVAITGAVKQEDRGPNIAKFQAGEARVCIGTISAGGVSVTLTAASTVVFLDRSWSPALNSQAEDRLDRYGQKNAVQVIDIMARGTVDIPRRETIQLKWEWIKTLLGDK